MHIRPKKFYSRFLLFLLLAFITLELLSRLMKDVLLTYDTGDEIETVAKLNMVKQINPSVIFVGSSRVAMSVNTKYLNEKYHLNSYNFAFSAANQWIMRNYLEWLLRNKPETKNAIFVIGIDPDSNFEEPQLVSTPASNRIPKYLGLKQALRYNNIDAETFFDFFEEASTNELYLYRFRAAWRNMIFSEINHALGKQLIPTVEKGRIVNYMSDHGYDNITTRYDKRNIHKQVTNNTIDTVELFKRFHRTHFKMLPGINYELRKLEELAEKNQLRFYIYLPPVWIEKFRTKKEMDEFYTVMNEKLPSNKGIIDLSSLFRNRDTMFMDFQHLRHAGTFETADSIFHKLRE